MERCLRQDHAPEPNALEELLRCVSDEELEPLVHAAALSLRGQPFTAGQQAIVDAVTVACRRGNGSTGRQPRAMCGNESLLRDKASERSDPSVLEILRGVRAETGRRRFRDFVEMAWPYAETRPFIPNWHIDAIADHLQAVTEGHIRRLLITVPPGHAKSLLVSVFWPAWQWLVNPTLRGIFTSYDADLAMRDSVRCRGVLASDWFQETFRPK